MDRKERALKIIDLLKEEYPDASSSLDYKKDYELLFGARLAAQCTDERVNKVTKVLYKVYPTLQSLAEADISELENYVRSTGFFRAKPEILRQPLKYYSKSTGDGCPIRWKSFWNCQASAGRLQT